MPSIRFANIRDGEEDYEYLVQAAKRAGRKSVEALVRKDIPSVTEFTRDSVRLSALRESLATLAK